MLSDCINKDQAASEIFVVQANHALPALRNERDRMSQAILPVGSAIINLERSTLGDILANEGCQRIIAVLCVGFSLAESDVDDECLDVDRLRYRKIILVTDETEDGRYIRTQVLALIYRFMRPVITKGHVYWLPVKEFVTMSEGEIVSAIFPPTQDALRPVAAVSSLEELLASVREDAT